MSKVTLSDVTSLTNENSALATINANSTLVEVAFDNTLSRDGTTPNQMSASLDMNSNRILNLPQPGSSFEPLRLIDATLFVPNASLGLPGSSTDQALVRWNGTGGNSILSSTITSNGSNITIPGNVSSGGTLALTASNAGIEIGSTSASNTPFIDGHSSGSAFDYDARLLWSGGAGAAGNGIIGVYGQLAVNGKATVSTSQEAPAFQISPLASSPAMALKVFQNLSGTLTGGFITRGNYLFLQSDNIVTAGAGDFYEGLTMEHHCTAGFVGGRTSLVSYLFVDGIPGNTTTNQNYSALGGIGACKVNLLGTGTTPATARGAIFGTNGQGVLQNGATNILNVTGGEFNTAAQTGSSVSLKSIIQLSGRSDDAVAGSTVNAMLWMYNQGGTPVTWTDGILIDNGGGAGAGNTWPINAAGNLIRTSGSGTVTNGIDFSNTTFTGSAFKSTGFAVDGSGGVTAYSGTAVPAGGTTGKGYKLSSTSNLGLFFGSGAPTLAAAQGSLYVRSDGSSASTRLYVNTNGASSWTNVTTAA